ncbi:MAG TPA: hypothetical protein VGG71_09605, partial [Chitinophagaceae bacterium]
MAHYAIRRAARKGCLWALAFLIQSGVNVNPPIYKPFRRELSEEEALMSPLDLALKNGNQQAILLLK